MSETLADARNKATRRVVVAALRRNSGNVSRAAEDLDIARPTLYDIMRDLGLDPREYR